MRGRIFSSSPSLGRLPAWAAWATVAAVALGWHGQALAYCRTTTAAAATQACTEEGAPLFWRNECRGVRMDPSPLAPELVAPYTEALKVALAQWDRAECPEGGNASISIDYLGETDVDYVGYDDTPGAKNGNAIFFRTDDWAYSDGNQVALTTVTFRSDTGDILDADIEVNATLSISTARPLPDRGFDLQTVFAHELGHVLGLAHSTERAATMFATYNPGTIDQGELEADDRSGLCAIYLPDGSRAGAGPVDADECDADAEPLLEGTEEGCGCRTSPGGAGPMSFGMLGLLGVALLSRIRSRIRRSLPVVDTSGA